MQFSDARSKLSCGLAVGLLALGWTDHATAGQTACERLKSVGIEQTTITATQWVGAANGLPAYCEITATVAPVAQSRIGMVYRLPEGWNGKVLGLGGGAWAGNIALPTATPGLKAGYATLQTDTGHPIPTEPADFWRPDKWGTPEALTDFQHRAIHTMTRVGKRVVAEYYGRAHSRAYFHGCSTGGRQGLMEVQRYPDDYDGVVSMAPVYNLTVQTSAVVRNNVLGASGTALQPQQLERLSAAVLQACDAKDGLADGVIADPRQCAWDPAELQCQPGQSGECLTSTQVGAVRAMYDGVRTRDGRYVAWPLARGGEAGWRGFVGLSGQASDRTNGGGLAALGAQVFGDASFDVREFDPDRHFDVARNSAFAQAYEANDPDISAFVNRGGKLLLWHGWNDGGPSPWLTIDYFEQVRKALPQADRSVRLFMAPGVEHCSGGPGADQFDALTALDRWVEQGVAPDVIIASNAKAAFTRPLCAYPKVPHYKGTGDTRRAESFECR